MKTPCSTLEHGVFFVAAIIVPPQFGRAFCAAPPILLLRSAHPPAPLHPSPCAAPPMPLRHLPHTLAPLLPPPRATPPIPLRRSSHPPAPLHPYSCSTPPIPLRRPAHPSAPLRPSPRATPPISSRHMMLPPSRTLAPMPPLAALLFNRNSVPPHSPLRYFPIIGRKLLNLLSYAVR